MQEIWYTINEFPEYEISSFGNVIRKANNRLVRPSINQSGNVKIGLTLGGKQYTRSLKRLVAEQFVEGQTNIFNDVINLDGDHTNNNATNLQWRPRWFVISYTLQFKKNFAYANSGPVKVWETGEVFATIREAGCHYGMLFSDIVHSVYNTKQVFPQWYQFVQVRQPQN